MKVILLEDVKSLGKKGDVVEVADGYGKNFLIKKGMAKAGTASNVHEAAQKKAAQEFHRAEEIKATKALADSLNGKSVSVKIKVSENGKVFGSITSLHVAEALNGMGYDIDKKKIKMDSVKSLGSYPAEIRFMEGISAKVTVIVESL
ncbi:MAG: 50S ribosomal protein L9 [Clostridia bacterium]|nr:50S ribosomal protein L9 [Clostridia bacterium]